jgi:predicted TIM-barrel fold metal-dependent hydrolase
MLAEHSRHLTAEQRRAILYENVKELYRLDA